MDDASRGVVAFLQGIQDVRQGLHPVWNHYVRLGYRVSSTPLRFGPIWALAGYFDFGVVVSRSDGRSYDLSARLRWSGEQWVIQCDASLEETEAGGELSFTALQELPEQQAEDWPTAVGYLREAIAALIGFDELVARTEDARAEDP